jgi:methylglutaconyl-CoA hydratase
VTDPGANAATLVRIERAGPVATLILDSPSNRNALSRALVAQLAQALKDVAADDRVRAVVLAAEGPTFCAGADLSERRQPATGGPPGGGVPEVLELLVGSPKVVVAQVEGAVRGGGLGLLAASDIVVASTRSTFAFSEVRVGVAPAMVAVPLLRVMQTRALAKWALTGDVFSAEEAQAAGLVTDTVVPADLEARVAHLVDGLRQAAPGALAATKALLAGLRSRPFSEALAEATARSEEIFGSDEAAEGMAAFLEKRSPSWTVGEG